MQTKLQKWGNSVGLRIPMPILKELNLKPNELVEIFSENNKIMIIKKTKEKISLKERIKNYEGQNLSKEFAWDSARGNEIW